MVTESEAVDMGDRQLESPLEQRDFKTIKIAKSDGNSVPVQCMKPFVSLLQR